MGSMVPGDPFSVGFPSKIPNHLILSYWLSCAVFKDILKGFLMAFKSLFKYVAVVEFEGHYCAVDGIGV